MLVRALILLGSIVLISAAMAQDRVVKMTSLEWPPFSGKTLPGGGIAVAIAREALSASGYRLEVEYLPWKEATSKAAMPGYSGYLPAYREEVLDGFVPSDVNFTTPLRVAQRRSAPLTFSTVADLKGLTLGVVDGYANTVEFDALVTRGEIKTIAYRNDMANLLALAVGKVDGAMVDENVFIQLVNFNDAVRIKAKEIQLNATVVEKKDLFVAFADTPDGRALRDAYNAGLAKINTRSIYDEFLNFAQHR